jgi:hypothetical protein
MLRMMLSLLLIALAWTVPGCRRTRSPERQVREAIEVVVKAVGERDIKPMAAAVSEQYSDKESHDKQHIVSLLCSEASCLLRLRGLAIRPRDGDVHEG